MAKGKNMLGKFRGKVGATVFRTEAGIGQIASEYNPNPKNPRTLAQTKQRSKMNLAGLISSLTPYAAIAGLNTNGRMARSEFVSRMLKAATVTGSGTTADPFMPAVAAEDILFSKGQQKNFTSTEVKLSDGNLTVSGAIDNTNNDVLGYLVVAMLNKGTKIMSVAVKSGTTNAVNVTIPMADAADGDSANVYVIPILDKGDAANIINGIDVNWARSAYSSSTARSLSAMEAYGRSVFVETVNFTAA